MLKKIFSLILIIILVVLVVILYDKYSENNFGEYSKAEVFPYTSKFSRDDTVRFSENMSYKIESTDFNDALFYKKIQVKPNTAYKVTAMVKTENVITENEASLSGAQICIYNTTESSKSLRGTNEFTKIEFIFNSKNREEIDICFRLGGYDDNCIGTAWFSDFTLEEGDVKENTTWNFACLIIENIDVNVRIDGVTKNIKLKMNSSDVQIIKDNMSRFKNSIRELSGNSMIANYEIIDVKEPITSLSYNDENAYFVEPKNILEILNKYCEGKEYDHIFVAVRLRR